MTPNASQPILGPPTHLFASPWLANDLSVKSLVLVTLAVLIFAPKFTKLIQNVLTPLFSIPGPLINKISSWPLAIATINGSSHDFAQRLHEKHGPIVVLAPGMVSVSDTTEIKRIIQTEDWVKSRAIYGNFRQDPERPTLLAFTDKKPYSKRKRMVSSMFGIKYIRSMEPLMLGCVEVAVDVMGKTCDGATGDFAVVDLQQFIHGLAIDIIGVTTFGQSFHVVENGSHPLPSSLKKGLKIAGLMQLIPWIRKIPFLPTRDPYVSSFTYDIVDNRRRAFRETKTQDLLQKLVEVSDDSPGSDFNTTDVQDESVVMLTAGSETTANAELFTLIMLLKHPMAMQRVLEEVDQWYPPRDRSRPTDCGYSQAGMTYLQACIDEAMRLVPGQPNGSPREAPKDEQVLGYRIPRGTTVFPNTQAAHLQDVFADRPDEYIPERWLDIYSQGNDGSIPYWPFSAGSRVCIGKHFAMQEMHLTLVTLLRHFTFQYVPGQDESTMFRIAQQLRSNSYSVEVQRRAVS
ncbi:putative P450 monooxygenase [Metarhizium anisopliae]